MSDTDKEQENEEYELFSGEILRLNTSRNFHAIKNIIVRACNFNKQSRIKRFEKLEKTINCECDTCSGDTFYSDNNIEREADFRILAHMGNNKGAFSVVYSFKCMYRDIIHWLNEVFTDNFDISYNDIDYILKGLTFPFL